MKPETLRHRLGRSARAGLRVMRAIETLGRYSQVHFYSGDLRVIGVDSNHLFNLWSAVLSSDSFNGDATNTEAAILAGINAIAAAPRTATGTARY